MSEQKDILIFFSDQHTADVAGFAGNGIVRTPHMDLLSQDGVTFDAAYSSCPLCVPARMSFMTGRLPSNTSIFNNSGILAGDQTTFMHSLAAAGYETVLCGRMHFIGEDQRHGFSKRIFGDFTPNFLGRSGKNRKDLGQFSGTTAEKHCTELFGTGDSPVLAYDKEVTARAIEYLEEEHDKPQAILVGIYGPHFPYVANKEVYDYYMERVGLPLSRSKSFNYDLAEIAHRKIKVSDKNLLKIRAAYYAMVEHVDLQMGRVIEAWNEYLTRTKRQGIFIYTSDHGDQIGEREMFGKKTFFEDSVRVPMIWSGKEFSSGKKIEQPVNLMDVGPTLCEFTDSPLPPEQDGKSLAGLLSGNDKVSGEAHTFSEYIEVRGEELIPCRMVRAGSWKLITYYGSESHLLFNIKEDPSELKNLAETETDKVKELFLLVNIDWKPEELIENQRRTDRHHDLLKKWGSSVDVWLEDDRWCITDESKNNFKNIKDEN